MIVDEHDLPDAQHRRILLRVVLVDAVDAEDAAGLLDQGADYLRDTIEPHETSQPGADALATPMPEMTPAG